MIPNRDVTAACSLAQRASDNPPWHGAKILVVEDSYLLAEMIGDFLRDCGLAPVPTGNYIRQY